MINMFDGLSQLILLTELTQEYIYKHLLLSPQNLLRTVKTFKHSHRTGNCQLCPKLTNSTDLYLPSADQLRATK